MKIMNKEECKFLLFVSIVFGCVIGFFIGTYVMKSAYENSTIKMGYGRHNPTTAEFEWINKNENYK